MDLEHLYNTEEDFDAIVNGDNFEYQDRDFPPTFETLYRGNGFVELFP